MLTNAIFIIGAFGSIALNLAPVWSCGALCARAFGVCP